MIAFYGYDGFMYSVGWLVAYLTVLLVVAEPAQQTLAVVDDCLAAQVKAMVVLSSGFSEIGPEGAALEAELLGGPGTRPAAIPR